MIDDYACMAAHFPLLVQILLLLTPTSVVFMNHSRMQGLPHYAYMYREYSGINGNVCSCERDLLIEYGVTHSACFLHREHVIPLPLFTPASMGYQWSFWGQFVRPVFNYPCSHETSNPYSNPGFNLRRV